MLHLDDVVEEIATKRQGKIDEARDAAPDGLVRVHFEDGKEPLMKYFIATELGLVKCPHTESGPAGFYPSRPLM